MGFLHSVIILFVTLQLQMLHSSGELIVLDFDLHPQQIITLSETTGNEKFQIEVNQNLNYKFSIALESMQTSTCDGETGTYPYFVVERGMSFDTTCISSVNYKDNNFQNAFLFWISSGRIQLSAAGKWGTNDHAQFVASVFQEVQNCSSCPNNTFCCEEGGSCKGEPKPHNFENFEHLSLSSTESEPLARCIPISLLCNEHPNCGRICNADESPSTCGAAGFLLWSLRTYFIAGILIWSSFTFLCL